MSDEERAFLGSNFHSLDEGLREYLVFNGLISDRAKSDLVVRPNEVLQAKVDYLALKVDSKQL